MENILLDVATRIKELREISGISVAEMSEATGVAPEVYVELENGNADFTFSFIHKCAARMGVDATDLLRGHSPTLKEYSVTRAGDGMPIARREGFTYNNIAPLFKEKIAEPFVVTAPYTPEDEIGPMKLSRHEGQEFNYILSGKLKVYINGKTEILSEGDSIYYDSTMPHGMIAVDGECKFLAVTISAGGIAYDYPSQLEYAPTEKPKVRLNPMVENPTYEKFITTVEEDGVLKGISFHDTENYNFGFDTVDAIAEKSPHKLAMLHLDRDKNERRFSFGDMKSLSNKTANYFASLGISRGDNVMVVLKRHWEFWPTMLALHKIGAVAIPATSMLVEKDFAYRFDVTKTKAIICTVDGDTAHQADMGAEKVGLGDMVKIMVRPGGRGELREGWHDFGTEFEAFPDTFDRPDGVGGNETMFMLFTSGTTGYPKVAEHCHTYALAHFLTARAWHNADPRGLHFTISDTGWGKALWGKLYGQWLCESAVFTYDFDRFDAHDILPLFAKYGITSFCAPPTMYRFFIKEDITKYDLSSLKYTTIAGEALNPEVYERWLEYTGLSLMEGFGQTETTLTVANFVGDEPKPGSMGRPSPAYKVMIMNEDGTETEDGETGEIVIETKGGKPLGLMKGYYNNPEATEEVWHDGYYHTGDTAWRDESGHFWYVGRVDDVIKSSGYRIGPFEIESVIMELPYVLECAITAAPDPVRGQVVKATIVLVKGKEPSEDLKKEIQSYVKTHTAPYKYPRIVEFIDEMPKTISGKIRRTELRNK